MLEFIAVLAAIPAVTWRVVLACIGSAIHAWQDKKIDPTVGLSAFVSGAVFGVVFTELTGFILVKMGWLTRQEVDYIFWTAAGIIGYSATDWLLAVRVVNGQFKDAPIQFALDFMAGFLTSTLDFINKNRKPKPLP